MTPHRYVLDRDRTAWWDPAGVYATSPGKKIAVSGRCFGLDPATTSPNVVVAIRTSALDQPYYLRPGEIVTLDAPARNLWVSNPACKQLLGPDAPTYGMLGCVVLLAGEAADLIAWQPRANRTRPTPSAAILAARVLTDTDPREIATNVVGGLHVPTVGLEKVRVTVIPRDAAGVPNLPLVLGGAGFPADLAATLRIWRRFVLPRGAAWSLNAADFVKLGVDEDYLAAAGTYDIRDNWIVDSSSDVAISATQTEANFDVGAGGLAYIQVIGLAGTDVTDLFAVVEGS